MPIISFKKQFADSVKLGIKEQTIRKNGKRKYKVGDKLYLYTGLRTKGCKKLGEGKIKAVKSIYIDWNLIVLDGEKLNNIQKYELSHLDGFNDTYELEKWFDKIHGLPFEGRLIKWDLVRRERDEM